MNDLDLYDDILRLIKQYQDDIQKRQYIPVDWKLRYAEILFSKVHCCLINLGKDESEKAFTDIKNTMALSKTTVQDLYHIVSDKLNYNLSEFEIYCDNHRIQYDHTLDLAINIAQMLLSLNQNNVDPFHSYINYFKHINSSKDLICKTNDTSVIMVIADMCNSIISNCDRLIDSLYKIIEGRIEILKVKEGVEQ